MTVVDTLIRRTLHSTIEIEIADENDSRRTIAVLSSGRDSNEDEVKVESGKEALARGGELT